MLWPWNILFLFISISGLVLGTFGMDSHWLAKNIVCCNVIFWTMPKNAKYCNLYHCGGFGQKTYMMWSIGPTQTKYVGMLKMNQGYYRKTTSDSKSLCCQRIKALSLDKWLRDSYRYCGTCLLSGGPSSAYIVRCITFRLTICDCIYSLCWCWTISKQSRSLLYKLLVILATDRNIGVGTWKTDNFLPSSKAENGPSSCSYERIHLLFEKKKKIRSHDGWQI